MHNLSIEILEKYIEGKDKGRYQILEEIYTPNAVVEFEIRSDNISFPNEIVGNGEIAKILSADFNKKYIHVKTYYLPIPEPVQESIINQKWLVVMKEISSEKTRIGTGYYDLEFTDEFETRKIKKHKIYIHEMLELADTGSIMLNNIQSKLDYPCVDSEQVMDVTSAYLELDDIREYFAKKTN